MRDARLAHIDPQAARAASEAGAALTVKQLAVVAGLSYEAALRLSRLPGFPLIEGRVFAADFALWRQQRLGLAQTQAPRPSGTRRQRSIVGKPDLSASSQD
jgi:hypothetical protein